MSAVRPKVTIIREKFASAKTPKKYREALAAAKRLSPDDQVEIIDELRVAADRLSVEYRTGRPRVKPRGTVRVRGRDVTVEQLA